MAVAKKKTIKKKVIKKSSAKKTTKKVSPKGKGVDAKDSLAVKKMLRDCVEWGDDHKCPAHIYPGALVKVRLDGKLVRCTIGLIYPSHDLICLLQKEDPKAVIWASSQYVKEVKMTKASKTRE